MSRLPPDRVAEIDKLIEGHAEHWRMERMAAVDRNLLRAGVAEFEAGGCHCATAQAGDFPRERDPLEL